MVMADGNPTQNITATVDPMAVAQAVRAIQKQEAEATKSQERKNHFQNKVKSLLSSEKVDKDNLSELQDLIEAKAADLKEEFLATAPSGTGQTTLSRYQEAVSDALDPYVDGDEQLAKCDKLLVNNAMEKLGTMPEVMAKFNSGQLDKRQIKNVVKEVVDSFSKDILKRDTQAKGLNLGKTAPGTQASANLENNVSADSIYDIAHPAAKTAALKYRSLLTRSKKYSDGDATKMALQMADRLTQIKAGAK